MSSWTCTAPNRLSEMTNLPKSLPTANEVHVVAIDLDLPEDILVQWVAFLSKEERARAECLGRAALRQRFIAVHGILRMLLGRYLNMASDAVQIQTGQQGKPYTEGIEFSLSHSRNRAVMAFSCFAPVGVDVEIIDTAINLKQVASLAFSPMEFETWRALPEEQQRLAFYQTWTCKEALLKALGYGMRLSPRKFSMRMALDEDPCLAAVDDFSVSSLVENTQFHRLDVGWDATAVLAVLGQGMFCIEDFRPSLPDWRTIAF